MHRIVQVLCIYGDFESTLFVLFIIFYNTIKITCTILSFDRMKCIQLYLQKTCYNNSSNMY